MTVTLRMPIGWPDLVEPLSEIEWGSSRGSLFLRDIRIKMQGEDSIGKGASSSGVGLLAPTGKGTSSTRAE